MTLATLYKRNENGSVQQWTIAVEITEEGFGAIVSEYGQVGGKRQLTEDIVREGKNIGRSNETTALEQASAEAQSRWEQKLKKGYVKTLEEAEAGATDEIIAGGVSPMLAHKYDDHAHKIKYPAFAQPKLDGHRCIAIVNDGECTLWSRTRKRITGVPHIERQLEDAFPNASVVLDGELYNHDYRENFEDLTSLIRSATPKLGHGVVQYWVYDIVSSEPQSERLYDIYFDEVVPCPSIVVVPTDEVENEEEMVAVFGAYINQGFEGLMLRNKAGNYKNGRSYDLQKVKVMQDAEFVVIGVTEGRGKMAGKAVFVCKADDKVDGNTFRCKMEGSLDSLEQYVNDPEPWIGRQLTVRFQALTKDGIPRFPVGVRFREDV